MTKNNHEILRAKKLILDGFYFGQRGHVPSAFSIVEILIASYFNILNINKENIDSNDRDIFILSKGHGCLALYAILMMKEIIAEEEMKNFCKFDSLLGGHPNAEDIPGVEYSSGSLGHGLSFSVGIAKALKIKNSNQKVHCLIGDGEINEGTIWEALLSMNSNKLDNLTIIMDYNKVQSFGPTEEVYPLEPLKDKIEAFNCDVYEVKDVTIEKVTDVIKIESSRPKFIICHTIKGNGIDEMEKDLSWHHRGKISEEVYKAFSSELEKRYA
tara:strand:+ start:38850 stop:39659 length:810 start_codon:yes stop_codon:yes gene_type:complete